MQLAPAFLVAALALFGFGSSQVFACQYCEQADDPTQQPVFAAPAAAVATPQATTAASLATPPRSPDRLPSATPGQPVPLPAGVSILASRAAKRAALRLPSTVLPTGSTALPTSLAAGPVTTKTTGQRPPGSQPWADFGLLGMAAAGGVFCWRTRRAP